MANNITCTPTSNAIKLRWAKRDSNSQSFRRLLLRQERIPIPPFAQMIAGCGLEPQTFGLWARRAAICSIPRCNMCFDADRTRTCDTELRRLVFLFQLNYSVIVKVLYTSDQSVQLSPRKLRHSQPTHINFLCAFRSISTKHLNFQFC